MSNTLVPLGDRVLVRRAQSEKRTPGGLYIPENSQEQMNRGEVLAVGPGAVHDGVRVAPDLKPGDVVVFGKYSGTEVELDGSKLLVLREDDVICKLA